MSDTSLSENLIKQLLKNQKAERRWRNIRFFILVFFLLAFFGVIDKAVKGVEGDNASQEGKTPYVALVRLDGEIGAGKSFSAEQVIPELKKAFADKKAKGVILEINSPGGAAVQAALIHDAIIGLKHQYKKKVVAVGEDSLASGAYMVATAADKIYVNGATLTGSIGVLMDGFGFTGTLQKLGVTRRLFTAGSHKGRLDPFSPLLKDDIAKVNRILADTHQQFIDMVKTGRKGHLHGDPKELFSGDFWLGDKAVKLGLVDGLGNLYSVMNRQFKVSDFVDYSTGPSFLSSLFIGLGSELSSFIAHGQKTQLLAQAYS